MIFNNEQQIFDIIKDNPNKVMVHTCQELSKSLNKYVTGNGLIADMEHLKFFERSDVYEIKKKITKTTKDLIERIMQPVDKVFTAKGGVKVYNLSKSQEAHFTEYLKDIRRGLSITEWVQNVAFKAFLSDPMGLIFNEKDGDTGNVYPTYKSIFSIYDYSLNGRTPEYVVFQLDSNDKHELLKYKLITEEQLNLDLFRVVDDMREYYVIRNSAASFTMLASYEHGNITIPAMVISNIPCFESPVYESPLHPIIEMIASYFRDDSDLQLYKKYQAHPITWSIELTCPVCEGQKVYKGDECHACDGTGIKAHLKPAERISITPAQDGSMPSAPIGFAAPPIEYLQEIVKLIDNAKDEISFTFWGGSSAKKADGTSDIANTATEILINERAKEPKLRKLSRWAQTIEAKIVDDCKVMMYGVTTPSVIIYGELYLHGTIEQLTEYYQTLIQKKAPVTMLDAALMDVYESKYFDNPMALSNAKKLMQVEPFIHNSVNDVMGWNIPDEEKATKLYYGEWVKGKTPADIYVGNVDSLKADLLNYANTKGIVAPPEPKTGIPA